MRPSADAVNGGTPRQTRRERRGGPTYRPTSWYFRYFFPGPPGHGSGAAAGRHEEALCEAPLAEELDPLSLVIMGSRAMVLYYAGRYDDAIAQATRALDLDPSFAGALCQRGLASLQLGKH